MAQLDDALDNLLGTPSTQSIEQHNIAPDVRAIDADTFEFKDDDGKVKKLRLDGVGAPEIMQIDQDTGTIKREEVTGSQTHRVVSQLAQEMGATHAQTTGRTGAFGRQLGDMVNYETGESLTAKGLSSGILGTTRYSSQGQSDLSYLAEAERKIRFDQGKLDKWDAAGILLNAERNKDSLKAKPLAATPWEYAQNPGAYAGTQITPGDRYFDNTPKSWMGVSAELGGDAVLQGAYGAMDMIGTLFGGEMNWGEAGNRALDMEHQFMASSEHMNPFDEKGNWKLDSFGDYAKFVIGTGITSLPQMGVTMASLMAAPVTMGATLAVPASMYAGQTWNDMEDPTVDDIPLAMLAGSGMAALDMMGIGSIGMGRKLFTNPSVKKKIIDELVDKNPTWTREFAESELTKNAKRSLAAMSDNYKDMLRNQMLIRNMAPQYGIDLAVGAGGEALTEAIQETIGTIAANRGFSDIDPEEFQRRIVTAAVGGGMLGGVFTTGGFAGDVAYNYDALKSYETVQKERLEAERDKAEDKEWQKATGKGSGYVARSKQQAVQDTIQEAQESGIDVDNIDVKKEASEQQGRENKKKIWTKMKDYYKYRSIVPGSTQGAIDTLRNEFKTRGRIMKTIFNSWGNGQGHGGPNNEQYYQLQKDKYGSIVNNGIQDEAKWQMTEREIDQVMRDEEIVSLAKDLAWRIENGNASSFREAYDNSKRKVPEKYANQEANILEKIEELESFTRAMAVDRGVPYTPGEFYDWRAISKEQLDAERQEVARQLGADVNLDPHTLEPLLDDMINDDTNLDNDSLVDQLLSGDPDWDRPDKVKSDVVKKKEAIKQALRDNKYAKYMNQDTYYKQEAMASASAAKDMFNKFYGADGKGMIAMLMLARDKGEITQDEYEYLAWEFKDQFDIMSNQYKTIDPNWRVAQNHLMFLSTLSVLPLATLSSLVETAVLTTGLTPQQIHENLMPLMKNLALEMKVYMIDGAAKVKITKRADYTSQNFVKNLNKNLGFESTSASARARAEATGNLGGQQKLMDSFFKGIFLQGWTNTMRMTAAGMAGDVIFGWAQNIAYDNLHNGGKETVLGRESKEALIELGLDPDELMLILDSGAHGEAFYNLGQKKHIGADYDPDALEEKIENSVRFAIKQFVNGRVAQPTKTNRPKLYYDPRFRMFMHFQGFISAFTSEILPRLYKNLVRGTPGLKYQAFATIMSMLAIAFLSQLLKDELKYGEPSPWLEDWKLFQRTLYSSGLLGVGERAMDLVTPLYGSGDGIAGSIASEAPALRYMTNLGEAGVAAASGDAGKAVRTGLKNVPFGGPFYNLRKDLGEMAQDLFEGEY